jgi:hypothetical protein
MSEHEAEATSQVDCVLKRAGLTVSAEERTRLIRVYPSIAEWTDGVRLPEARYAEPAVIYPATFDR